MELKPIENIKIEYDSQPLWCTVGKYKLFYHYGSIGMDAFLLYMHYQFTGILQQTQSVKALNTYCRQGLGWGKKRFQDAKNLLTDLSIIKTVQRRDKEGKITGTYIEVKMMTSPFEFKEMSDTTDPKNHPLADPPGGFQEPNALTNKLNALTNNPHAHKDISVKESVKKGKETIPEEIWKSMVHKFHTLYQEIHGITISLWDDGRELKDLKALIKTYGPAEVEKRMSGYAEKCLNSPGYFWMLPTGLKNNWNKIAPIDSGPSPEKVRELEKKRQELKNKALGK